jgi:hypothetical protein
MKNGMCLMARLNPDLESDLTGFAGLLLKAHGEMLRGIEEFIEKMSEDHTAVTLCTPETLEEVVRDLPSVSHGA